MTALQPTAIDLNLSRARFVSIARAVTPQFARRAESLFDSGSEILSSLNFTPPAIVFHRNASAQERFDGVARRLQLIVTKPVLRAGFTALVAHFGYPALLAFFGLSTLLAKAIVIAFFAAIVVVVYAGGISEVRRELNLWFEKYVASQIRDFGF